MLTSSETSKYLRQGTFMIPSTVRLRPWLAMGSMLIVVAVTVTSAARAQGAPIARPGEQVRGKIVHPATAALGTECTGRVRAVEHDTIIVSSSEGCPQEVYLGDLRVARGSRGSRVVHVAVGIVGGGITGAVVARVAGRNNCGDTGCIGDDEGYVSGIRTMVHTPLGMAVGAGIGAVLPAGPRWIRTAGSPARVAGIALRPEVRFSLQCGARH
jgi:hypothetical protein